MSGSGTAEGAPDMNGPGGVLRAEREALGVSVREVAETLNLSLDCVDAIEADDFSRLPGTVFARGYLRAYARLLEMDPEPLLAQYPEAPDGFTTTDAAPEAPLREWVRRRPLAVLGAAAAIVLILLFILVAAIWPDAEPTEAGGQPDPAVTEPANAGEPSAPDQVPVVAAPAPPPSAQQSTAQSAQPPADAVQQAPVADAPAASAGADLARRINDSGDDRLSFSFSDDCWVEVRSASGATLYSDLNRADTVLELVGGGPFRILLGYAPGARLTFNGEAVPLGPYTRDNVANLVLGQ